MDGGQDILSRLPEGCISHIISLTSPRDADRSALVCKTFKSASKSDDVWRRFLPPDLQDILSRSDTQVQFLPKRELYFRLCDPILIDGGKMSFSVDNMTGKKCFMLSARELTLIWGDNPAYWTWNHHPHSRFAEVAMLKAVCWLEIRGLINSRMLSPKTIYTAYLVVGYNTPADGLDFQPANVSVKLGNQVSEHTASLEPEEIRTDPVRRWSAVDPLNMLAHARIPEPRSDGWVEIELGDCYNDEGDEGEVEMSSLEIKKLHWMSGIIIEGIEIRPKVQPIVRGFQMCSVTENVLHIR